MPNHFPPFPFALMGMAVVVAASPHLALASPLLSMSSSLSEQAALSSTPPVASTAMPVNTLSGALAAAWLAEPRILEAENIALASGFDVQAARTGFFPYATVAANQSDDGDVSTSLRIIQPLWNGGLTRAQVDGARHAESAALAEVELARLDVGREVIEAYFSLLTADTQIEQWTRHVDTLERLVGVIQRRADEGVAPEADVQTAVSRARQAEAGRETSRALAAAERAEIARLTGLEPGAVQWPPLSSQLAPEYQSQARDRSILENHPQRKVAQALIEQQQAEQRRQMAALWPELQLQYRVDVEGVRNSQSDGAILALEYQTGNGLRGYRTGQAEAQRTQAAAQRRSQADREITARLRVARSEVSAAIAQRRTQAAAVAATDVLLDSFLRQFEVGRKSWVEVLNASREANDTRLQAIRAEGEYWRANASLSLESLRWERLLGGGDAEGMSVPKLLPEPTIPVDPVDALQVDPRTDQPGPEPPFFSTDLPDIRESESQ